MSIRWEDPPPGTARSVRGVWIERLTPLLEHPKRWAIVAIKSNQNQAIVAAHSLRIGQFKMPPGRWEFVARAVDGEHRVYGRYLGPDQDGGS